MTRNITRRDFIRLAGLAAAGTTLAACGVKSTTSSQGAASTQAVAGVPTVIKPRKVRIAVGSWAEQSIAQVLEQTGFTKKTGIEVEVFVRSDTKETELSRVTSAVQANTAPYDVIDFEDELTTAFSQAGYVLGLNDLIPSDLWDDFSTDMKEYSDVWATKDGEVFRIIHNWEMPYWWYRKDWFDAKGVAIPTTWEEVAAMGEVFTDEAKGVWATEDGLVTGGFLNVYLSWITLQAGGNLYDVGPEFQTALEYIYDLMHSKKALNPASLQKDYPSLNGDYQADKVAFLRQWPYVYDVFRTDPNWFKEDKAVIALPPVGPAGKKGSTYAAAWGFGIIRTSPNLEEAKELLRHLMTNEVAAEAGKIAAWYVSARKSVLAAVGEQGMAKYLKMYTDEGVIGVRPFHPQFVEASTILENTASAFLTDQLSIENAMKQAKDQMARLND
jgi:ABC-type glycerol-3-phosphate transport system substrate-binding protein